MKTRSGFVANSSSSAFVLAMPTEIWEKVLPTLSPFDQAVAKALVDEGFGFGQNLKVIEEFTDAGSSDLDYLEIDFDYPEGDYDEDDEYSIYEAFSRIVEAFENAGGNKIFSHSVDRG